MIIINDYAKDAVVKGLNMQPNAQRAIPDIERTINDETRIYRGEECPIVRFNNGPFKNRIYVRFRGSLVHVGNRKMVPVTRTIPATEIKQELLVPHDGAQKEFMNSKEDTNGNTKS